MTGPTGGTTEEANRFRLPAITGLSDLIDQHARDCPGARALVATGDRVPVSYGALAALVDDVAVRLADAGLSRGDVVGLISTNTVEFVVALLGAARAGLVVAPLDPTLPHAETSARLERLGARTILVGPATVADFHIPTWPLRVDVSASGIATATFETGAGVTRHATGATATASGHDALVLFTSGTTNQAKMVPLTHANVAASVQGICGTYELGREDATVAIMPLFHGHGLFAVLLATLASGGCVLLPERGRFSARTFWHDMQAVGATWFTAVPTIHEILLSRAALEYPGPEILPLRFARSCSAPLNVATAKAMERALGAPLLSAYGMTETTHQATSEPLPSRGPLKAGSVGRGTGARVRIIDQNGHPCPANAVGEVHVHGPTVARGYLNDKAATERSFDEEWFRTGDLGALDEDGYLFLAGRIKNIINRGGEKISPEHVESILAGCAGVTEAAVFAIPDPTYGERVGAAVVIDQTVGITPSLILHNCRNLLSPFEVPDTVKIVDALPHTAKGALDRRAVECQYAH
jgi:acyl-CoA synthetase (AMP-forming)/AMP-acid ligase II